MPLRPAGSYIRDYNRLLGNRQNRPISHPYEGRSSSYSSGRDTGGGFTAEGVKRGASGNRARIAAGTIKLPTATRKRYEASFGPIEGRAGRSGASSSMQRTLNAALQEIEKEAVENYQQKVSLLRAEENQRQALAGAFDGFDRTPAGRALDLVSRPAYSLFEGLKDMLDYKYNSDERVQPKTAEEALQGRFGAGLAGAGGAYQGISGEEKTGAGQVYETFKTRDPGDFAGRLRELEKEHPALESWLSRGVGAAGEIFLDPTNLVGAGFIDEIADVTRAGSKLTRASEESLVALNRQVAEDAIRKYADQAYLNYPNKGGWRPTTDSLIRQGTTVAEDQVRNTVLSTLKGSHASRGRATLKPAYHAPAVANRVTESVRAGINADLDQGSQFIIDALKSGQTLYPHQIDKWLSASDDFKDFMTKIDDNLVQTGRISSGAGMDEVLDALTKSDIGRIRGMADEIRVTYEPDLQMIYDEIHATTRNPTYRSLSIRVGNSHIPLRFTGKAWQTAKKAIPDTVKESAEATAKSMSFEHNFPGKLSLVTQRAHSLGVKNMNAYRDELQKLARQFTKEDATRLHYAIERGHVLLDPKLEAARQNLIQMYDDIYFKEVAAGARNSPNPGGTGGIKGWRKADNYVYVFNRRKTTKARGEFKARRKDWVHEHGNAGGMTTEAAKKAGLKPVENAFDALMMRYIKMQREMTRAYVHADLLDNYGIHAQPISGNAMQKRGLTKINYDRLRDDFKKIVDDDGGDWYMPSEQADLAKTFNELTKWNSASMGGVVRQISKATNLYKASVIMPFTGYHVRNMIGDVFMGLLDKINPRVYEELSRKMARGNAAWKISDSWTLTTDQMRALYEDFAATGFVQAELDTLGKTATSGAISRSWNSTRRGLRGASQWREDFGRIGHFIEALRQEARALEKAGIKDAATLERRALDAATWRVNHFKFDYNALTATERRIKTLAFPFYTFTRKAIPTLVEQLFLNPHWLATYNRFQTYNDGSAGDAMNNYFVPEWLEQVGYADVGGSDEEPLLLHGNLLPTNTLNTFDVRNSSEFFRSGLSQLNPIFLAPIELATRERMYDRQPTGDMMEYLWNKFQVPQQAAGALDASQNSTDPAWLQTIQRRFFGLGVPLRTLTTGQQAQAQQQVKDELVDDPFREFNYSQENFSIYEDNTAGEGTTYVLRDKNSGQEIGRWSDPRQALDAARNLGGG